MRKDTMTMPAGLTVAERFFWTHAGYSWKPMQGETEARGRERCARNLAAAEGIAREAGYVFDWQPDAEATWEENAPRFGCIMRDVNGRAVQSLWGIGFGDDADGPYGDYRRVVEAELASQECDDMLKEALSC